MKRNRIKAVLTAMATVVSVLALCLCAVACNNLSVWQFDDHTGVNGYTATAIDGTIKFENQTVSDNAYVVYVSPSGANANDGTTEATAVNSIKQAQILVRAKVASGFEGDCVIVLDDGEYFLSGAASFSFSDVPNGGRLIVKAKNTGKATISGAKRVAASAITEENDDKLGRVWKIPCGEKINQLYVNGNYAIRARYPDSGEYLRLLTWDETMKEILVDKKDVKGFSVEELKGSTLVAQIMWAESYVRVKDVVVNDHIARISLVPEDVSIFARSTPQIKERQSYHFENSFAFLSERGEFWYSDAERVVYYLPHDGETLENTTVRIPYTEELIKIKGAAAKPVSGVYIEGINFMYSANAHIDGKIGNQANKDDGSNKRAAGTVNDGRPYSAITVEYANDLTFIGNTFACLGGGAIDLVEGAQNVKIVRNLFRGIGGSGVLTGTIHYDIAMVKTDDAALIKDVKIEHNYFNDIAWQEYGGCAVVMNYSLNGKISHNTINDTKYSAISVGWGWKRDAYPFLENNEVSSNYISNAINLLSDGSAIYLVGCQPNSKVFDNYIENTYDSVWKFPNDLKDVDVIKWAISCIYLDEGVGGTDENDMVKVYNNNIVGGNAQQYFVHNAKDGTFSISEINGRNKNAVKNNAGADKQAFGEIYSKSKIFGFYMESKTQATVFGENLKSSDSVLVLKGKDGKFTQLAADDIITWKSDRITFNTENYLSGEAYLISKDGTTSGRLFLTLNVDEQYEKYDRFEEEWGGLTGLARIRTRRLGLLPDGFKASSELDGWPAVNIDDNSTSSGWSAGDNDPNPYVSFELDGMSKAKLFILYARAGFDQPETRRGFEIHGYDAYGDDILLYSISHDEEAFGVDGMLVVNIAESLYADTIFSGFKICRAEGDDTYLFVAEVAVIAAD